jgi:hypothetical protein
MQSIRCVIVPESATLVSVFSDSKLSPQSRSAETGYGGHSTLAPVAFFRIHFHVHFHNVLRPTRSAPISREATTASGCYGSAVSFAISFAFPNSDARAVAATDRKD